MTIGCLLEQKIHLFPAAAALNPCADFVTPYLNIPAVKAALHVLPDIQWTECTGFVLQNYFFPDLVRSMIPVYQQLLEADLRIWVYRRVLSFDYLNDPATTQLHILISISCLLYY
jgi:hypothetical protein